jgi:hypothetical protein
VTPLELLEEAVARADRCNPAINAIIHRLDDAARMAARGGIGEGPFAGVPYLVKDLGPLLSGAPMCMGSRAYQGFIPDHDSEIIQRSKAAGLNIFGKTNTGVRHHALYRAGAVRAVPQSLGPRPHAGRLERWRRRVGGCRYRPHGTWQ